MTAKTDKAKTKAKSAPVAITEDQVLAYLRANPSFLADNIETLSQIASPERPLGEGVVDLQQAMIGRLRKQVKQTEDVARVLIDTSRDNLSTMARIHECVLSLLDAHSFEELIQRATVDLGVLLDVDVAVLCVESNDAFGLPLPALKLLPAGSVDAYIGRMQSILLQKEVSSDPAIFGEAAPMIHSHAMVRLKVADDAPPAMLAFGSREPDRFHGGQATELLSFLAHVLEKLMRVWLDLPGDLDDD